MNIDLEKLLELAAKMPKGPWRVQYAHAGPRGCEVADRTGLEQVADRVTEERAQYIAAANPSVITELVNMVKASTTACIADVQAEPEFPGEVPPELMAHIRQCIETKDEQSLIQMMRMAVSITKKCIQERIAARTGISIEGIFGRVVRDQCSCGEPISVELDCPRRTIRTDKKRPFYPDEGLPDGLDSQNYSEHGSSVFRCRKCGEPVGETVPAAKYGEAK